MVAVFTPKSYTVTLNAGEGSLAGENQITLTYNTECYCPVPTAPIGKDFLGYKLQSGELVTAPSGYVIYNLDYPTEFIAVYTEVKYLVFIHIDGTIEKVEIKEEGELSEEDIPEPKQLSGKRVKWEISHDEMAWFTETTEIKAVIDGVYTYVATYKTANKDLHEIYRYGQVLTLPTAERDGISKNGYTFLGWSYSSTDKTNYFNGEITWNFTKSVTFYAVYKPNVYKVTYDYENIKVEGQLYNGENLVAPNQTVDFGGEYSLYTLKTDSDIVTVGWTYNGELIDNSGVWKIASDVTLVAKITSYKNLSIGVNLNVNGGTGNPYATVILGRPLSELSVAPTAPSGYKLVGYKFRDKTYLLEDIWDVIDYGGEPLIAEYIEIAKTVTLNIDLNGGTGSVKAQIRMGEKLTTISPKPIAQNGYKLTGFTYKGKFYSLQDVWDVTDYDGSRLIAQYEDDSADWGPIVSKK